ncbi:MAG: metallopeptidase TldD-related protein [Candidatus Woesearchaeota archaeon]
MIKKFFFRKSSNKKYQNRKNLDDFDEYKIIKTLQKEYDEVFIIKTNTKIKSNDFIEHQETINYNTEYFVRVLNFQKNEIKQKITILNDLRNLIYALKNVEFNTIEGSFFSSKSVKKVDNDFSRKLRNSSEYLNDLDKASKNKKIKSIETSYVEATEEVFNENSYYKYSYNDFIISYYLVQGTGSLSFNHSFPYLHLDKILQKLDDDLKEVDFVAKQRSIDLSKVKVVKFSPSLFHHFASELIFESLRDANIYKNLTFLNENVEVSDQLKFIDVPFKGMNNLNYDFEFTKVQPHNILKNGKFSPFVSKFYLSALRYKFKNSNLDINLYGHYFGKTSYRTLLMQSMPKKHEWYNFYNPSQLAEEDTLVIDSVMGLHTANSKTTEFSVVIDNAYFNNTYTQGQIISGNLLKLLKNIIIEKEVELNSDYRMHSVSFSSKDLNLVQN